MAVRLLAFDLGAESGRAVVGELARDRLRMAEVHRFGNEPIVEHGHLHWNLPALWNSIQQGLRAAGPVDAVGVDTWGVDYGLIDDAGRVLGQPFHYRDSRNVTAMEAVLKQLSCDHLYRLTGVQVLQINTLFQLVAHGRDDPGQLDRARTLLFMPDLFRFLLTGARGTEPTIASTSQLYDPRRHGWSEELIEALALPRRLLPPIEPADSVPTLRTELAGECGVAPCPVIPTPGHDTAAAVAAVPAIHDKSWCYISSGTWSLMGVELAAPIVNEESMRLNFTNEVGFGGTIRFLRNIVGLWLTQECRRELARQGREYDYQTLTRLAAAANSCGAILDLDHPIFLAPDDMPEKIHRFCRQTRQTPPADDGQLIRCCLESLAMAYRRTLNELEQITGKRIEVIHIVGGGSRNELLNQMTADACNRPVIAGPAEATAAGNLLAQSIALGALGSLSRLRQVVADSFTVQRFQPRGPRTWDELHHRYLEVMRA